MLGWRRGVELMQEGDHWELYVPYYMAYDRIGRVDTRPAIPVFSPLIINVWLDKINPTEEPQPLNADKPLKPEPERNPEKIKKAKFEAQAQEQAQKQVDEMIAKAKAEAEKKGGKKEKHEEL